MAEGEGPSYEELQQELQQAQSQLTLAAEFGQQLVENNQRLEKENEELRERVHARNTEIEYLGAKLQSLEEDNGRLRALVDKGDARDARDDHSAVGASGDVTSSPEYRTLLSRMEMMKEQLEAAAESNKSLIEEVKAHELSLEKYKGQEKEVNETRAKNQALRLENDSIQGELSELREKHQVAHKELGSCKAQLKKVSEAHDLLEGELHQTKKELETKDVPSKKRIAELTLQLQEAEKALDEAEQAASDLKWENKKVQEGVAALAIQNGRLERERDENLRFLQDARNALASFRKKEEESSFAQAESSQGGGGSGGLLGELEKEFAARTQQPVVEQKKPVGAPEGCEDFFYLAATAVKISLAINSPQTSDGCFQINVKALYQQCLDAEIQFHEWYEWIKVVLRSKQKAMLAAVTASVDSPVNQASPVQGMGRGRGRSTPSGSPAQGKSGDMPAPRRKFWNLFGSP